MTRTPLPLLLVLIALAAIFATEAFAHGGNFRAENPANPGSPGPAAADVPSPVVVTPGSQGVGGRGGRSKRRAFWLEEDWRVWWMLNSPALYPARDEIQDEETTQSGGSPFALGPKPTPDNTSVEEMRRCVVTREQALPFLLELVDPHADTDPRLVATALIALGRVSIGETPLRILERYALDTEAHMEVRESAVLALGLLRRTDPELEMTVEQLRRVRTFLLDRFDDDDSPTRVRAFAAYSIGLLADQPYDESPLERDGRAVTREIWLRMGAQYPSADLRISLLTALSMQPPAGVPSGIRDKLREILRGTQVLGHAWDGYERAHALTALSRLDRSNVNKGSCLPVLLRMLGMSREHVAVRCAAAIALGERASEMEALERDMTATALREAIRPEPNWTARGQYLIALGHVLQAELHAGEDRMLVGRSSLGRYLHVQALDGTTLVRPFAALAVGLACHRTRPTTRDIAEFLKRSRKKLEQGLTEGRGTDDVVAVFPAALGLSGAVGARELLLATAKDRGASGALRAHAAVALGMLGHRTRDVVEGLGELLVERHSGTAFLGAVKGLALLDAPGTVGTLVEQLGTTKSVGGQAAIAAALGRLDDLDALPSLVELAKDEDKSVYARAMGIVAIGLICDPEPVPSRRRMTVNSNYPARTASMQQLFNIM